MVIRRRRQRPQSSSSAIASNRREGIDGLRAWLLSLPFVSEHRRGEGDAELREFVVDCPPLHIRRIWLVMCVTGPDHEMLAFITHDDGEISCVGFGKRHLTSDPGHVEAALLLAYQSALAGSWPTGGR